MGYGSRNSKNAIHGTGVIRITGVFGAESNSAK